MPDAVVNLDSSNFKEVTDSGVCVVDFWAPWCGPCKMLNPIIESLSGQVKGAKVVKVDIDSEPKIARDFSVRSVPTIIIMKDGGVVNRLVGMQSLQSLLAEVRKLS
jgi:thioredoxin 1